MFIDGCNVVFFVSLIPLDPQIVSPSPPCKSTGFRIMHEAIGMLLWDLESLFRCTLPWQQDLYIGYTEIREVSMGFRTPWETNYYRDLRAKCKGLYISFQGVLNPVDTKGAWYTMFRQWCQQASIRGRTTLASSTNKWRQKDSRVVKQQRKLRRNDPVRPSCREVPQNIAKVNFAPSLLQLCCRKFALKCQKLPEVV